MSTGPTREEIGLSEPGFERFAKVRKQQGTTDETLRKYASTLGMVRALSAKPLLNLSVEEVETLDIELLKKANVLRVVLRMFYKVHKKRDLLESLPTQHRPKERRLGLNEVLSPDDVMAMIAEAGSLRDRAIIAVLAATGGRINEVLRLRLKDIKESNGSGYQMWFGTTKVKGAERYSPKVDGAFKQHLDKWLVSHPDPDNPEAWIFPSTTRDTPIGDGTIFEMLTACGQKAGIKKNVAPHQFRHARVTWGILNGEDTAKLCIGIWGQPSTPMLNRYSHFTGLDTKLSEPVTREMSDVPSLPVALIPAKAVASIRDELRQEIRAEMMEEFRREREAREAEREADLVKTMIEAGYGEVLKERGIKEGIKAVFKQIGP